MTEIIVKLTPAADTTLLKKAIENMKGVFSASIREIRGKDIEEEGSEWLEKLHRLKNTINPDVIDMDDDRTRYIVSK